MPYVDEKKDRPALDPYIWTIVAAMRVVENKTHLKRMLKLVDDLAEMIKAVAADYGYYAAFAGELNYAVHKIFLNMILCQPVFKYWMTALSTGWLKRAVFLFKVYRPSEVMALGGYEDLSTLPFGTDRLWKHLTELVAVRLACLVAPDDSVDASDLIAGVFEHIDTEFYRRVVSIYEDQKIEESGDLPEYQELLKRISKL